VKEYGQVENIFEIRESKMKIDKKKRMNNIVEKSKVSIVRKKNHSEHS
jgi:hypothetical protein